MYIPQVKIASKQLDIVAQVIFKGILWARDTEFEVILKTRLK